jgi:hypothetical protein
MAHTKSTQASNVGCDQINHQQWDNAVSKNHKSRQQLKRTSGLDPKVTAVQGKVPRKPFEPALARSLRGAAFRAPSASHPVSFIGHTVGSVRLTFSSSPHFRALEGRPLKFSEFL